MVDRAEFLLANKADANARDGLGRTPLHRAAGEGNIEAAKLLLANGAGFGLKDANLGRTPLHDARLEFFPRNVGAEGKTYAKAFFAAADIDTSGIDIFGMPDGATYHVRQRRLLNDAEGG